MTYNKMHFNTCLCFIFLFCQCNSENFKVHIEYYKDSKKIYYKYERNENKSEGIGTYYDELGNIIKVVNTKGLKVEKTMYFVNGLHTETINNIDSTRQVFFMNGCIRKYEKFNYDRVYYFNFYDSVTSKPIGLYRNLNEYINLKNDSIIITPYLKNFNDILSNYTHIMVLYDSNGLVLNTMRQTGINQVFKFKKERRMKWTKITCDSIGCCSVPYTLDFD